jgi:DNA-binding MarR family transcriptional regulator
MNNAAVTLPQVLLMSQVDRLGSASLSDLARGSNATVAAMSQMIERLVQQQWLYRAEDPLDRRRKAIAATPRARAFLRKLEAARSAEYELGLACVNPELRARMARLLARAAAEIEHGRGSDRRRAAEATEEFAR